MTNKATYIWDSTSIEQATGLKIIPNCQALGVSIDSRPSPPSNNLLPQISESIFIGLPGERFNGGDFAQQALNNGAKLCFVNKESSGAKIEDTRIVIVDDPHKILDDLAAYNRHRFNGKIIAITGSCGKTTTKDMIASLLSHIDNTLSKKSLNNPTGFKTFSSYGNFNNTIGLPLMLSNLPPYYNFAVLEMGMNSFGEIKKMTCLAQPHIAIITNIYPAHIGKFSSINDIVKAKSEIFIGLSGEKIAIIPADSEYTSVLAQNALEYTTNLVLYGVKNTESNPQNKNNIHSFITPQTNLNQKYNEYSNQEESYSSAQENDIQKKMVNTNHPEQKTTHNHQKLHFSEEKLLQKNYIISQAVHNKKSTEVNLTILDTNTISHSTTINITYNLSLPNETILYNSISALSAVYITTRYKSHCRYLVNIAASSLINFTPLPGRGKALPGKLPNTVIIDDAYNANPGSVTQAIQNIDCYKKHGTRTIVALGDMLEMGSYSAKAHQDIIELTQESGIDLVYTLGKEYKKAVEILKKEKYLLMNCFCFDEISDLSQKINEDFKENDIILVKGSKSMQMYKLVETLTQ